MALVIADRVQDTTSTTGTGAISLDGAPPAGYQSFAAIGNGNTTYYTISGGSEWEVGIGTYNSTGATLNRDTVLSSSNGGALVNFSAGVKVVFVTYPAERSVNQDAAGNVNINITGNAATATKATNLNDGTAGAIPYQSASNVTTFLSSASGVLVGGNPPTFSTAPTLTGTNFTSIPNAALTNSSVTIGSTSVALGATATTLAGLTSVTLTQDPTANLQAATKQYVDNLVAAGIHYHTPVKYEAPNPYTATYNNGTAGVGATLTNAGTLAAFAPDGIVADVNDRILIYQQANAAHNGIYVVTTVGDGITPWVLTRANDANTYGPGPNGLGEGSTFYVQAGNTGAGEVYTCTTTGTITFGTTAINFVQISASQVYSAGTGLTLSGTVFSLTAPVATSLGGTGLTTFGAANRALYSTSSSALTAGTLPVAAGGTGQTSYTDGELLIGRTSDGTLLKGTLTSGGSGLSISNGAGSITITNTAPDQTVTLTGGGTTVITGSYPNFNITSNDQYVGTVTSVSGTGTVNGLTLTGTVTSSGSLTLGGTLSGVDLTTAVTGTLPVANGGTGANTHTTNAVLIGNGTSAITSVSAGTASNVLTSNGTAWVSQAAPPAGVTQAKATGLNFIFGL